jgi:Protein of unknown function (DUF3047)
VLKTNGRLCAASVLATIALLGCATTPDTPRQTTAPIDDVFALPNDPMKAPWQPVVIRFKTPSTYIRAEVEGVPCVLGEANASWSLLGANVPTTFAKANTLSWQWHVPSLVAGADNESRDKDDAPARVVVAFKGDRSTIDAVDRSAMNMAKLVGGWEIPYASIQYIWEPDAKPGTVIPHHTVSRIKKIVVRSGEVGLATWVKEMRDLRADYRLAFNGEEPGEIESIALMTDTDTMHGTTKACYANLRLQ